MKTIAKSMLDVAVNMGEVDANHGDLSVVTRVARRQGLQVR